MRQRRLIIGTLPALALAMLAIAGCGSTSKTSSTTTAASAPLSHAELVARASAICAHINAKIAYYSNLTPSNSKDLVSSSAIASAAPQIAAVEHTALGEMEKLTPPPALAGDWQLIVGGVRTISEDTAKIGEAIKTKDTASLAGVMTSGASALQRLHVVATRDGLAGCSKLS
jgi:hypothetical protein